RASQRGRRPPQAGGEIFFSSRVKKKKEEGGAGGGGGVGAARRGGGGAGAGRRARTRARLARHARRPRAQVGGVARAFRARGRIAVGQFPLPLLLRSCAVPVGARGIAEC